MTRAGYPNTQRAACAPAAIRFMMFLDVALFDALANPRQSATPRSPRLSLAPELRRLSSSTRAKRIIGPAFIIVNITPGRPHPSTTNSTYRNAHPPNRTCLLSTGHDRAHCASDRLGFPRGCYCRRLMLASERQLTVALYSVLTQGRAARSSLLPSRSRQRESQATP